ncbi:LON peptidase substrate-binding domain-containing protein [Accumulibacter sp.]|uniref:LON peptidase substrate-binding domain-containing protein n=1 Tax=Accumulibacter sp. TaxID=2053492 RepID=UPI0025F8AD72|nr:LON peptidase substrate-binding domain-containing protein [Accumulibacter sp.]MCM8596345.1 LON peptidase substrate-binding domain-containing protein [Accumulibacter sp.]MCM8627479.1 LON peptidase substrate-binding domain-containing protein [Accumulibacter sp.]MDS4050494.1 LON peptidase substrate-binding domain-containing protein [Accumulibacter sp.]
MNRIPLFPLGTVLFPGSRLSLKVFEQRYLDMVAERLRADQPFGVCLIRDGNEVGPPAEPHPVGTLAHIVDVDVPQLGIMVVAVRGGRRFRIAERTVGRGGLQHGDLRILDETQVQPVPPEEAGLRSLLQALADEMAPEPLPEPHAFDDAAWVGYRLAELLPMSAESRQKLLEIDDPLVRLRALAGWLREHLSLIRQ